jgi:small conductance mechanosensitive channel
MTLTTILLQSQQAVADSLANLTKKFSTLPDSLATVTPQKIHEGIKNFNWNEVINQLTDTGVSLALRILAAVVVFIVGRFLIIKTHNLLRSIMVSRDVDRSLTTFLLSLFKITFFFILAIIVISIMGIETSSFIAIFASAGIAIGMAFSGTLQNFAGGVLILLLKPYRVGDYIEFETHKGTVKEIQIFHTIITTYNNESIIIPNGGLSTGTINNYSRERARRLEWRVAISYGDDVDVAREVILNILNSNELLLKPGTENDHKHIHEDSVDNNTDETQAKGSWYKRWLRRHKELQAKAAEWREEKRLELDEKMPKLDYTPNVNVESLDDSSVTLVVRAWCTHANYWPALYQVNEAIYKQLPKNGIRFPFPQLDVHLGSNQ